MNVLRYGISPTTFGDLNTLQHSYQLSYWERDVFFKDIDFAIIGSGIVGLSAALRLIETNPDLNILILERGPLPIGASTRNAGFACFGSMTELLSDIERMGEKKVWKLVRMRWEGLKRLRQRVGDAELDFRPQGGFELFHEDDKEVFEKCLDYIGPFNQVLQEITGHPAVFEPNDARIEDFGFRRVKHLIHNRAEGQLHAGRMVRFLLREARRAGINIITGLPVHELQDTSSGVALRVGPGWDIKARKVLVATNALARQLVRDLPVVPARNQVMITEPIKDLRIRGTFHYDKGYYYFRDIDGRLLIGGGRDLAQEEEQTPELGTTPIIRAALMRLLQEVILPGQDFRVETWWSGLLGIGDKKFPIIRRVSDNVVVGVRLGGMGIAIGSLLGEQGADLAYGKEVSSPS